VETLRTALTTAVRELDEELATVPANRRVEALSEAKKIVDSATRKVGSLRVGAGGGADASGPQLTKKAFMHTSTKRLKGANSPGRGAQRRPGVSMEERRRLLEEEEGATPPNSFVRVAGGLQAKVKESMGGRFAREAKEATESDQAGGGVGGGGGGGGGGDGGGGEGGGAGGGGGDGNVAASRGRAPGTCSRCKELGAAGSGHTKSSRSCPNYVAPPPKRKATEGAVGGARKIGPYDTNFVEGNVFDNVRYL
jgi:hypothetical protein